jgi:hypothetical protein
MLVTELMRSHVSTSPDAVSDTDDENLIDMVEPRTIDVDMSVEVTEIRTIFPCSPDVYSTKLIAKADPPEGLSCLDEAEYEFSIIPPPVTFPPSTAAPLTNPPSTGIPLTNPPSTGIPLTNPPSTGTPLTNPPSTDTPDTNPPFTDTPDTNPPSTDTPDTNPPSMDFPVTISPTTLKPSDLCFAQVDVECVPPVNPEDINGDRFEDCDSINIAPAECTEFVYVLTFRFNGGDCLQSNNIQDPRIYQCEDYFGGPPTQEEIGAESYLIITDIKGQGINYYNGPILVGDIFNITNILPNSVIVANVNATFYDGEPSAENLRQTMVIHTSCSQVTFLKDRYGALELIGFGNPSQGYLTCIVPVSFNFFIQNTAVGFNAVIQTLTSISNFDPPNDFLNFTPIVAGTTLGPGDSLPVISQPIDIDLSVRKRYTVFTTVQGISPEAFSCRGSKFTNFTAGQPDTRPTFAPVAGGPSSPTSI